MLAQEDSCFLQERQLVCKNAMVKLKKKFFSEVREGGRDVRSGQASTFSLETWNLNLL